MVFEKKLCACFFNCHNCHLSQLSPAVNYLHKLIVFISFCNSSRKRAACAPSICV